MAQKRYQFPTGEQQLFTEEELKTPAVQRRLEGATLMGLDFGAQPITSTALEPVQPFQILPKLIDTTNYNALIAGGQGIIGANLPKPVEPTDDLTKRLADLTASIGAPPPKTELAYQEAFQTSGVETAQRAAAAQEARVKSAQAKLAGVQAQIQAVISKRDVQNLQLEKQASAGQVVTTVLNRQQQEINRQAAIEALPLQAQALAAQAEVAALQGEAEFAQSVLGIAQEKLNTAFKLRSEDIKAEYEYKRDARKAIFDFFTEEQKTRATAKQKEEDAKLKIEQDNLNNAQTIAIKAMDTGQADIAAKITQLNPKSKTFLQDLAVLQAQIKPKPTGQSDFEQAFLRDKGRLPTVQELLDFKARESAAGRKGESPNVVTFTDTQIANGAATAGIPLADFQRLDQDTQNFFINNDDQIKAKKKIIDNARENKEDPSAIEKEISESNLPDAVKDSLGRYLKQAFPQKEEKSLPWWKRIFS